MSKRVTYILLFNTEVLYPSYNIKTLYMVMWRRNKEEFGASMPSYHTVRRAIIKDGKFSFAAKNGFNYHIIARHLLHKPVQRKLPIEWEPQSPDELPLSVEEKKLT